MAWHQMELREMSLLNGREWYRVRDLAGCFHRSPRTIRRLVRPYRAHCHLDRDGRHPRKVLWIPRIVAKQIEKTLFAE